MTSRPTPDVLYAELFKAVQEKQVLGDSKTFVDAVAKSSPDKIMRAYRDEQGKNEFDLRAFVTAHFELPLDERRAVSTPADLPVEEYIERLWEQLTRRPDSKLEQSSLLPLPHRYVVPGGRFREVYYWDSYFTMLGLADAGQVSLIRDMVENFASLIDTVGFIPNGNRSYYCTRSQPPYFALMVDLLAEVAHDDTVYARFLPHLKREYAFWMAGSDLFGDGVLEHRRVVCGPDGFLNRYWDDAATPRQESYAEDIELAASVSRDPEHLYRDIRAGAESGWDYSARWFEDRRSMQTIRTTRVIPIDLNTLLYNLEATLARICGEYGDKREAAIFKSLAEHRKMMLQCLFFDETSGMFMDLALPDFQVTGTQTLAAAYPLFFGVATQEQAERVAMTIHREFLKEGGWVNSNYETGQQWDSPNGWAPMQWLTYCGLRRYGFDEEALTGAKCWVENNLAVYERHGCLLEKYNVVASGLKGTGGEYEVQEGFGWTNAVLLRLMQELANRP